MCNKWSSIETAPKDTEYRDGNHHHGPRILAYSAGRVLVVHWWWSDVDDTRWRNFLGDCGNAFKPSHWQPLPPPPGDVQ